MTFLYNTNTQQQSGLSRLEYITMKAIQYQTEKDGLVKLNRGDIAERLGVNRVTINRIVLHLTELGFLENHGFSVKVLIQV